MEITERQRYDFRREIERISSYQGRGTELISLYVPAGKMISDVANYLREEQSQSSNIKSSTTRKNVQSAISSILSRLKYYKMLAPDHGIAFFVGTIPKNGDQTTMVQHVIEPPEPIGTFLYRCDSSFYLDPLKSMLEERDLFGLLVIDRKEATIGFLRGQAIQMVKNMQSLVPSKHRMGGQSSLRFERLIEIAANEYFKEVAEACSTIFLGIKGLKGILVGGPGGTKDFFVKEGYLHYELQSKVVDTLFDTGYTDEYGLRELVENARDKLKDLDIMKQKALVEKFMTELRKQDGGLAAYGIREVKASLDMGAVALLLVSEGLKKMERVYTCGSCGNVQNEIQSEEAEAPACGRCGTQMSLTSESDIVDEMFETAERMGTEIELISDASEEGKMLLNAFGGLAAVLRYRTGI